MSEFLPVMPMQTVPAATANLSVGLFQSNTGAPLPGPGTGPSASVAGINPLQATNLLANPGTITPFDPFNAQVSIPAERSSSLNTGFPYPTDFTETFENATNQVGESDLSDRRANMPYLLGNAKEFGEPEKGAMVFIKVRPSQPYKTGHGKKIQTQELHTLQQLNYILAKESAKIAAVEETGMDIEGLSFADKIAAQYRFLGFLESYQDVERGRLKAVVVTNSGSYDEIPPLWPGSIRKGEYLGLVLTYIEASDIVGGKYTFAEGKSKAMPANADRILQIMPVNFGSSKVYGEAESLDLHHRYFPGMELCVGMSKNEIRNPKPHTYASFYSVGTQYDEDRHDLVFECGNFHF